MPENAYDTDGFRTVTLRVDRASRSAAVENNQVLHYGDSVTLVVTGVEGCDPSDLVFGVFDSESVKIDDTGAFAFVPGSVDAVYASVSLATAEALAAVAAKPLGDSATVRLYLFEQGGKTWMDTTMELYPEPAVAYSLPTPPPAAGTAYVTKADIAAAVAAVIAMPTLNAAQRESRFAALLTALSNL